jgi:hypothetical protein
MVWTLKWWGICRMEFKRCFLIVFIAFSFANIVNAQTDSDKPLQLRYDIFKEVSFTADFDMGSYLNNNFIISYFGGSYLNDDLKNNNGAFLKSDKNPFGTSFNSQFKYRQLPETFMGKHNLGYSIAIQQNYYQEIAFTKDAYNLVFFGNKMYSGDYADLSNMKSVNLNFYQVKAGLFWQNRDKNMEYGFQIAVNLGNQFHYFASDNAQLFTDSLGEYISLVGKFQNNMTSNLDNNLGRIQGIGSGIDLYFQKYKKQEYKFRVELNNLGFIHWNKNSLSYNKDESIEFSGIEVPNIFDISDPLVSTTASDTLNDYINANSSLGSFNSFTPSDLKMFGNYFFNDKLSASAMFTYRFFSVYKPLYHLGIQYHFSDKVFVGPNVNYGGYTKINIGLDFQMKINNNFVLKLQTRYLIGLMVNQFSGFGAYLGINYKL